MNNDPPLDQIQEPEVSTSELDEVIGANKDLFDKLNKIPEIEALGTVLDEEDDEGLDALTIYEAAKRWKDDVLTEHGWENGTETFYETPLKVVAIEEEPKTEVQKVAEQLGIQHLGLLEKLSKAVNSKAKQKKRDFFSKINTLGASTRLELSNAPKIIK